MWLSSPSHPDSIMLWAASCVGFFSFLRVGEFIIHSPGSYDASVHLSISDLAGDGHTTTYIIVLNRAKRILFGRGWTSFVGQQMQTPVQSKPCYKSVHCTSITSPLFEFQSGSPLMAMLVSHLRAALQRLVPSLCISNAEAVAIIYNGHLPHWSGHHNCSVWFRGLLNTNPRPLEKFSIQELH